VAFLKKSGGLSAGPLRAKAGKTMPGCAAAGVFGMLPEASVVRKCGNRPPPQVLPALQRRGLRAQRSVAADLIFGSFHQGKEQRQPAAIERCVPTVRMLLSMCNIASFR